MKPLFVLLLIITGAQFSWAQSADSIKPTTADTLHSDSVHLAEQQLLNQQQQEKIDELVKARIQKELQLNTADAGKQKELLQQLRDIQQRDSIRSVQQNNHIARLRQTAKPYPVTLDRDTLFYIYSRTGSFNAAERAAAISNRIDQLYQDEFFNADTLQLVKSDDGYDIVYNKETIVMTVSQIDAMYLGKDPRQLGEAYLQQIKTAIKTTKDANSLLNWARRLGLVALVIAGIFIIIFIINRLFRSISRYFMVHKTRFFRGISFNNYKFFTPRQHLTFFLRALSIFRVCCSLLALYLALPLLFNIFPQTKTYTYTLLNWIITPAKSVLMGIIHYLPNLFTILVIYLFTRYTIRGIKFLATEIETGKLVINGFFADWAQPTYNIVKFLLYAFMVVVIFPYLPGSNSPAFQGVSVFLGILFSLGSSSAIANIVAGLVITYMRPFRIGDRVKIGEITGDVLEKTMLVTRIRTIKNEEITVPNSSVLSNHTVNYTLGAEQSGIILHTTVTLGYDVPWKTVHQSLITAALRTDLILGDPAPFVLQTGLEDFYVAYQINAYTKEPSRLAVIYSNLHQNIQDCCNEAGIEILSPHYRAVRDGNMSTIPQDYLPKDYTPPAFGFEQKKNTPN